jgi:PST family polysaccharide transporter
MAFARVIGEASLALALVIIMIRLELLSTLPGAGRMMAMARFGSSTRHGGDE